MKIDLSNIDVENYGSWPMSFKVSVVAILCVVILFLGYWLDTSSQLQDLDRAEKKETELKLQFAFKQRIANNLPVYQKQMQLLKNRFQQILQILPENIEIAGLLEEISKIGISNGLKFELVKPLPIERHEFYTELPIKIQVDGNYHQFAGFISEIAALNRIVTLDDFTIKRLAAPGTPENAVNSMPPGPKPIELQMEITARTYWAATAEKPADTTTKGKAAGPANTKTGGAS